MKDIFTLKLHAKIRHPGQISYYYYIREKGHENIWS